MIVVAAIGGNALLRRGERMDAAVQLENAAVAALALAPIARDHTLVVTHGNGPQVGLLALETGSAGVSAPYPLDVLGSEAQGMVGYLLETALRNELAGLPIATVLSQVLVDADDVAFKHPTKPVGPVYQAAEATQLSAARGWKVAADGPDFRRVVPAPEPLEVLELPAIRALLAAGVLTISAGGGGVPVVRDSAGRLHGVEGVVDKDLTAALLARELHADALLLLTDVSSVWEHWGMPGSRRIRTASPQALRRMAWAPGSIGPKIEAAARFVESSGNVAAIGGLAEAAAALYGLAGTRVQPGQSELDFWESGP